MATSFHSAASTSRAIVLKTFPTVGEFYKMKSDHGKTVLAISDQRDKILFAKKTTNSLVYGWLWVKMGKIFWGKTPQIEVKGQPADYEPVMSRAPKFITLDYENKTYLLFGMGKLGHVDLLQEVVSVIPSIPANLRKIAREKGLEDVRFKYLKEQTKGGRIFQDIEHERHDPKQMLVYERSVSFGAADHAHAALLFASLLTDLNTLAPFHKFLRYQIQAVQWQAYKSPRIGRIDLPYPTAQSDR